MRRKRTRAEMVNAFFLNKTEISTLFEIGRRTTDEVFRLAMLYDREHYQINIYDDGKVRMSTVCQILQISESELRRKASKKDAVAAASERNED